MKGMEGDDQRRVLQTIDQVHVLPGYEKKMGWDDQTRGIKTIDRFHVLPHTGEDGIG